MKTKKKPQPLLSKLCLNGAPMEGIKFALRSMACNITKKTSVSQSLEKSTLSICLHSLSLMMDMGELHRKTLKKMQRK